MKSSLSLSKAVSLILLLNLIQVLKANEFYPANILQLDSKLNHHVILVEKFTHKLTIYENENGVPKFVKDFQIATGKTSGDKKNQGDFKTPEGIYQFNEFYSNKFLAEKYGEVSEMYGAGAFTISYPNPIDQFKHKGGGGIWLHSTDDNSRISKGLDSRGCVVVVDEDLKEISKYIDLPNTSIVIVEEKSYLDKATYNKRKEEINSFVQNWTTAWKEKNFQEYINKYSKEKFTHHKGNFSKFSAYKKALFSAKINWEINFSSPSILINKEYAVVTMIQDYKSDVVVDIGKKILYLQKNSDYKWEIVAELWNDYEAPLNVAFTPSMRYFIDEGAN